MDLPSTILYEIFAYLPVPQRWECARVCRSWRRISQDPYLYRHVCLENLEFQTLVRVLHRIVAIAPRIQSLTIDGCYSRFVQKTVVPVPFSDHAQTRPSLFSHITTLQSSNRRVAYRRLSFELHDQFSDVFRQLMALNTETLRKIIVRNCQLDLEMTEFFCTLACHGRQLSTLVYADNHDDGVRSAELLQAIVTACPKMQHFHGSHAGMSDMVLYTMARHWPSLQSLSLINHLPTNTSPFHSTPQSTQTAAAAAATGNITGQAIWNLITHCVRLRSLKLHDIECDLAEFGSTRQPVQTSKTPTTRFKPYAIPTSVHAGRSRAVATDPPGQSLRHLVITKYITCPLSVLSFRRLVHLFPNLDHIYYETNFFAYSMKGFDRVMYDAEQHATGQWFEKNTHVDYRGQWSQAITTEQRLIAGIAGLSDSAIV